MPEQVITPELRDWIATQTEAGHAADTVLQSMMASGWERQVAMAALDEIMQARRQSGQAPNRLPDPFPDGAVSDLPKLWAHDRWVKVLLQLQHPRIVVFGELLSAQECHALIEMASPRLSRSQTVVASTGDSEVNDARTSRGMFFDRAENELCGRIEARISALLHWPVDNGEGIQVLQYLPGAEYKPHFDYFDPAQPGTTAILQRGGQRVGTLIMYLNTPEAGGATVFPDIDLTVQAMAGHAVFFAYGMAHPSSRTLHGGAPVRVGEKWVATKWLRESSFE
ncbi:MAG: 2OG-Fe(II) oxygenase [Aquabacterium sp.]